MMTLDARGTVAAILVGISSPLALAGGPPTNPNLFRYGDNPIFATVGVFIFICPIVFALFDSLGSWLYDRTQNRVWERIWESLGGFVTMIVFFYSVWLIWFT